MKAKEVNRLYRKYIQPEFPQFVIKGFLIYLKPVNFLLRGVCFESSSFESKMFNINIFIQPIFIKRNYLWFSFGDRLNHMTRGNDYWWNIDEQNEEVVMEDVVCLLREVKKNFLDRIVEPRDLVKILPSLVNLQYSIEGQLTIAYTHILHSEKHDAEVSLDRAFVMMERYYSEDITRVWVEDWMQQVTDIRYSLCFSNEKAIELLKQWRNDTLTSVHLTNEIS